MVAFFIPDHTPEKMYLLTYVFEIFGLPAVSRQVLAEADRFLESEVEGFPGHPLPPLGELIELHERASLPARRASVAAIALNTRDLDDEGARAAIAEAERETGLPADDPVRFGAGRLLEAVAPER